MIASAGDVYKAGVRAATLRRVDGATVFAYRDDYVGAPVATTLPLSAEPVVLFGGAVPPFFAGLLPEGRRLTNLRITVKTSADDELALLLAIGEDPIGDVQVVPSGAVPLASASAVQVDRDFSELRFDDLLDDAGMVDPAGLAGVQPKVSARMISLPVSRAHERFILKLSPPEFPAVVENEAFFLDYAHSLRISSAQHRVVTDAEGRTGLLVTRFDRVVGNGEPRKIAVEDACQLLGLWPADKYNVSMEELALAIIRRCGAPLVAAQVVFTQVVFAWLTGNGDLHAKNVSVLQHSPDDWRVAPAYDLPSTLPYDDNRAALEMQGKRDGYTRRHFVAFAAEIGLPEPAAQAQLDRMLSQTSDLDARLRAAGLPFADGLITKMQRQLSYRRQHLA